MFSGWDNIWIEASENSTSNGEFAQVVHKSSSVRKMPNDHRWFTSSCNVDPRGDGKIEGILARGSLAEPPQSVSPVKAVGSETSGRSLKRSTPLKVASSPSKRNSVAMNDVKIAAASEPEPATKKTKLTDTTAKPGTNAAAVASDKPISSANQTVTTKARTLPLASNRAAATVSNPAVKMAPTKTETVSSSDVAATSLVTSTTSDSKQFDSKATVTKPTTAVSSQEVGSKPDQLTTSAGSAVEEVTSATTASENKLNAGEQITSSKTKSVDQVDASCDMEVDQIVSSAGISVLADSMTTDERPVETSDVAMQDVAAINPAKSEVDIEHIQAPASSNETISQEQKAGGQADGKSVGKHDVLLDEPKSSISAVTRGTVSDTNAADASTCSHDKSSNDEKMEPQTKQEDSVPSNQQSKVAPNNAQSATAESSSSTLEHHVTKETNKSDQDTSNSNAVKEIDSKDDDIAEQPKTSNNAATKADKPVAESSTKSTQKAPTKAADSDSEEDVTLSEIVKMKSKAKAKAPGPKSHVGTRTSSRRRKPSR